MIKLLNGDKLALGFLFEIGDYYIESTLDTADKIIHFRLPMNSEYADKISHEMYLQTQTDEFVIKELNYSDYQYLEIFGKLNVEDLKRNIKRDYESVEQSLDNIIFDILIGTGWGYQFINPIVKNRTIRKTNVTPYDLIMECAKVYGLEVEFDTLNKIVKFYQVMGTNRGAYLYSDLNIKSTDFQSDNYDFITRLYPYGAEGLTIASVNNGLEYVENTNYATKVLEAVWEDERYTDAQSLHDDAVKRLESLAKPRVSFKVDLLDLASVNPDYGILDFRLGDTVKIIDKYNNFYAFETVEEAEDFIENTFSGGFNTFTFGTATFNGTNTVVQFDGEDGFTTLYGNVYGGDVTKSPQIIIRENFKIEDIQRIVKLIEYPITPEKNKAELANTQITFKSVDSKIDAFAESLNNKIEVTRTNLDVAIENATALIKSENGGYVVKRYNAENQPYELLIMDTPSIETADNVWRWNQNGLGFSSTGYNGTYGTAITKDGAIVADFITTGTLDAAVIGAGSITAEKLAVNSVTADKIASNAITSVKINANAVTAEKLSVDSVTADKIASNSITADKISADAITTDKIAASAITATEIATNAITSTKISADAVTADKLNVTSLSAITANLGTVTAGTINGVDINGVNIDGSAITGGTIELAGSASNYPFKILAPGSGYDAKVEMSPYGYIFYANNGTSYLVNLLTSYTDGAIMEFFNTANSNKNIQFNTPYGQVRAYDFYAVNNVSALTFTDRTPFYEGDALKEIANIKGVNGEIDHSTLPSFARVTKSIPKKGTALKTVVEEVEERDLGAMISVLTVGVQQLTKRLETLEGMVANDGN